MNAVSQLMSPSQLLKLADAFFEDGQWIQAYSLYRTITPQDTDDFAGIENRLGICAENLGNAEKAIEHHENAFKLEPHKYELFQNLINALADNSQFLAVTKLCDEVLNRNYATEDNAYEAFVYKCRGLGWYRINNPFMALNDLNKAIAMNAEYADWTIPFLIGEILLEEGRFVEAIPHFDKVPAGSEYYAWAANGIGACYCHLGQSAVARPYFEKALDLAPDDVTTRKNLLECLMIQKDWSEALVHASYFESTILPTEPQFIGIIRIKAICLRELGRLDAAENLLSEALQMEPENYYVHSSLSHVHLERGDLVSAAEHLHSTIIYANRNKNLFFAKTATEDFFRAAANSGNEEFALVARTEVLRLEARIYAEPAPQ